ncbi:MAG: hypothetical protein OQJ96_06755 [Flavobacteriales bacterium]|nr:hypothetical protein [Flavobacteriales bacterium]MCW8912946.1 hypothetical protein [Flavobacteriales bacterium]MCW8938748.1 hypothetical protein [Flavobacteriales bacterium]MCW8967965.1 hypothetical protein [Flavobacteriales bacterium]MCW8988947.1 hypothetical protein [Flavobacteriales bacterium]
MNFISTNYILKLFLLIYSLLIFNTVKSQESSPEIEKAISKAKFSIEVNDCRGALAILEEHYKKDTTDVNLNYQMGICYFNLHEYEKAEKHFNQSATSVSLELFRYKAATAHANSKFKKATNFYNGYKLIAGEKELTNDDISRYINQISYAELALKNKRNITVENLGGTVNTEFDECTPLVNADASLLLFSSNKENYIYDIYQISDYNKKNTTVEKLNNTINTKQQELAAGMSADGQTLFFQRNNKFLIAGNLQVAQMGLEEWEAPTELPAEIKSAFNETSASITIDNRTIYFSSNRPGGYGGKDIYKATKLPDGTWGKAQNLGPIINTQFDEDFPFIFSDGKTLYFSSKGHQNMGGFDLFVSTVSNESWSNPENLGTPINSVRDEFSIVLAADGKNAFFSSTREGGVGGIDLYKAFINDPPTNLLVLKGIGYDKDSNKSIPVKATLMEDNKTIVGIYNAKASTGEFVMIIAPEKNYNILVEAEGYHPIAENIDFNIKNQKPIVFLLNKK